MKPLIVYYSHSGNNEKLALELKERIGCEIHQIKKLRKRRTFSILLDFIFKRSTKLASYNINVKEYDKIIFVSPIWASKIATPMKTFIDKEKNNIEKYFYISLCNGEAGHKEKLASELYSIIQHKPDEVLELCVNNLLPEDKQNKIRHTFNFRVSKQDLEKFNKDIDSFIRLINESDDVV